MKDTFCATCGKPLQNVTDIAFGSPLFYDEIPESERGTRATLTSDTCTIDGTYFFVRGCLELPIRGQTETFMWGVWASLSQTNYQRYLELFDSTNVTGIGPFFGWLSNRIPGYPDTLSLKTHVHLRPHPTRPAIELEPSEHPLSEHQRNGIDPIELEKVIHDALHGKDAG